MTLKNSEVQNCSWRIRTTLKSFLFSYSSCHAALPLFVRPMMTIQEMFLEIISRIQSLPLMVFGLLASFCSVSRRTQGRSPFHPKQTVLSPASRNTISVSTITDGNARIGGRSTFPSLTLAWLYISSFFQQRRTCRWPSRQRPWSRLRGRSPP